MSPPRFAETKINDVLYTCVSTAYQDTISIMIYKNNKLGKIFKCQLHPEVGGTLTEEDGLIASVTPEPLLGINIDDVAGNLYTETIASLILKQAPHEGRVLILGMGNIGPKPDHITPQHRNELLEVIKLVQETRVW